MACAISSLRVLSFFLTISQSLSMNVIDSCWRPNPRWAFDRQSLANCAIGFGRDAMGGRKGAIYVVTDPSDDPVNPEPGTLRYGATRRDPLWITFAEDMVIRLKKVLLVSSYKTIDGRGAKVEVGDGPCIEVQGVSYVIVHGISIRDCKSGRGFGDGITVAGSSHVWIDHCFLSRCADGLLDVILNSTAITISNNLFTQHETVMLLGNDDNFEPDKNMRVTLAFNHFGEGLGQRMPRIRQGYVHIANNKYERWGSYAIGGSGSPTIFSEGNLFIASNVPHTKQVTRRNEADVWEKWTWKSSRDVFVNGAYFIQSGWGNYNPKYTPSQSFRVGRGWSVPTLTSDAGPLQCTTGKAC
ncbi:hypothetical protein RJ639_036340 [Escallonia herrerae]|uniref:Pectate lyase n=1 Tax=Escallonia herrerae TaxID=1293975 RepID=A0AA88WS85_9ASTE|nr:hypothetical protein RJ639_036340 [Escallonia herrerae]